MQETFFEYLERTGLVGTVLLAIALLGPLLSAAAFFFLRRSVIRRNRHNVVFAGLLGPAVLGLWLTYSAVTERYGLDSVAGLGVNAGIFAIAGLLLALTHYALAHVFTKRNPEV